MLDPRRLRYLPLKRALDVTVVLLALPLILLVSAVVALALYADSPGTILFRQARTGRHGRRFLMYKFRTMVANAEALKADLQHLNVLQPPDFKIPNDPRITRVGRVLRRSSLDELPQLLNVLRGDMSLVGPRPTSFAASTYELWHTARLEVPPGLTGPWQLQGRGSIDFDERLRLDITYMRSMNLWLDLGILLRTTRAVVRRQGT